MTDMTLEQALKLADQACPLPSLAGPALKLLRRIIESAEVRVGSDRWVTQTRFYDPSQPQEVCTGNCTEAALASILGMKLDDVPSFYGMRSSEYWDALEEFVESRGFWLAMMDPNFVPDGLYLADGPSERGCGHFVLMRGRELAHDPHPSGAGLKTIDHVWMLVPLDPAFLVTPKDC